MQFDLAPDANQLFPTMSNELIAKLREQYGFYDWEKVDENNTKVRFVCSWATPEERVDEFLSDLRVATS